MFQSKPHVRCWTILLALAALLGGAARARSQAPNAGFVGVPAADQGAIKAKFRAAVGRRAEKSGAQPAERIRPQIGTDG